MKTAPKGSSPGLSLHGLSRGMSCVPLCQSGLMPANKRELLMKLRMLAEECRPHSTGRPCASGHSDMGMLMQERELLLLLKVLEQRMLAEERGSHYSGASLAAEEERQPLLQRRFGPAITPARSLLGRSLLGSVALHACVPGTLNRQAADGQTAGGSAAPFVKHRSVLTQSTCMQRTSNSALGRSVSIVLHG